MELYKVVIKNKNKTLNENTYTSLVKLFMSNGYLDHASYFLCQMDRLKLNIPRELLDLFLDFSLKTKIFENADNEETIRNSTEKKVDFNKYDNYELQNDPEYAYYFSKKNLYKKRKDMKNLISNISMKVESKPFFPKNIEPQNPNQDNIDKIKQKLNDIDPSTIKEFIPKSFKIQKKAEN
jgi:pentatricopeptide repeat protein